MILFQSTHPVWGATTQGDGYYLVKHFNPRTPCGVRRGQILPRHHTQYYFNPRTPCGVRRLGVPAPTPADAGFQSTHPVWGATLQHNGEYVRLVISIHAPRVGCDDAGFPHLPSGIISIHAPRVGCDLARTRLSAVNWSIFQSTHPVWGATHYGLQLLKLKIISIHAPRVGCDRCDSPCVRR